MDEQSEPVIAGAKRRPQRRRRNTVLTLSDAARERLRTLAAARGLTVSGYVEAVALGDDSLTLASAAAVDAQIPSLIGHRCIVALDAIAKAVSEGCKDAALLAGDVESVRREAIATLLAIRRRYDADVEALQERVRRFDEWQG